MNLPEKIESIVGGMKCQKAKTGLSKAKVFKFSDERKSYYLKIEDQNEEVIREYQAYQWLVNKIPIPKIIGNCVEKNTSYLIIKERYYGSSISISEKTMYDK